MMRRLNELHRRWTMIGYLEEKEEREEGKEGGKEGGREGGRVVKERANMSG
jgi:hypothetical protein